MDHKAAPSSSMVYSIDDSGKKFSSAVADMAALLNPAD